MGIEAWLGFAMLSVILLLLSALYLQCRKCWRLLSHWNETPLGALQQLAKHAVENRELRSALRAHKAHVSQLQRKIELLQALLPSV